MFKQQMIANNMRMQQQLQEMTTINNQTTTQSNNTKELFEKAIETIKIYEIPETQPQGTARRRCPGATQAQGRRCPHGSRGSAPRPAARGCSKEDHVRT